MLKRHDVGCAVEMLASVLMPWLCQFCSHNSQEPCLLSHVPCVIQYAADWFTDIIQVERLPRRQPRRKKQSNRTACQAAPSAPSPQPPAPAAPPVLPGTEPSTANLLLTAVPTVQAAAVAQPAPLQAPKPAQPAPLQAPEQACPQPALPAAREAAVKLPVSIADMASMVNSQLGPSQQGHRITEAQITQLQKALGDVKLLLDLLGADDSSLNEVLDADGSLHAMQIVAVRRLLHSLHR